MSQSEDRATKNIILRYLLSFIDFIKTPAVSSVSTEVHHTKSKKLDHHIIHDKPVAHIHSVVGEKPVLWFVTPKAKPNHSKSKHL